MHPFIPFSAALERTASSNECKLTSGPSEKNQKKKQQNKLDELMAALLCQRWFYNSSQRSSNGEFSSMSNLPRQQRNDVNLKPTDGSGSTRSQSERELEEAPPTAGEVSTLRLLLPCPTELPQQLNERRLCLIRRMNMLAEGSNAALLLQPTSMSLHFPLFPTPCLSCRPPASPPPHPRLFLCGC